VSAHVDTWVRDRLPPREQWPSLLFELAELRYPDTLNCAHELLDRHAREHPDSIAIRTADGDWSYGRLLDAVNRICRVLVEDLAVLPGNRVLLRGMNSPVLIAAWLAVVKAGAVVVATMPMLRARELAVLIEKGHVGIALCEAAIVEDLRVAQRESDTLRRILTWGEGEIESLMARKSATFDAIATAQDDPCLIAFTSGTTGTPKATVHFHRDVLAMADTFARHLLQPTADDVFAGTPPLAFTFGLGAELVFPLRFGASTAVFTGVGRDQLLGNLQRFGVTRVFTAPTAYRSLLSQLSGNDLPYVRSYVSAGEHLPKPTAVAWHDATGHRIVDGIGSTEMIHIFISAAGEAIRPGSTGRAVPGYRACILNEELQPLPVGTVGSLAVQGPTGCRYLADTRQTHYVRNGWNLTGDAYAMDDRGYFWFHARADDMIISAGYNIAAPEVEAALLEHAAVAECAVVGVADAERGQIVKAFVVLREAERADETLTRTLQDFVKSAIAPYKYPRRIEYVASLPKTQTGKLQRFKLLESGDSRS
jgi:2-aminobenzoate-CoA ligase